MPAPTTAILLPGRGVDAISIIRMFYGAYRGGVRSVGDDLPAGRSARHATGSSSSRFKLTRPSLIRAFTVPSGMPSKSATCECEHSRK